MKRYTETHDWVEIDGASATVGVSDAAQHELGEIVFVELPPIGKVVSKGDEIAVVESTKAATDVYAPLSGTVTAVNEALKTAPILINRSAEKEGWMYRLKMSHPHEAEELLEPAAYNDLF